MPAMRTSGRSATPTVDRLAPVGADRQLGAWDAELVGGHVAHPGLQLLAVDALVDQRRDRQAVEQGSHAGDGALGVVAGEGTTADTLRDDVLEGVAPSLVELAQGCLDRGL